MRHSAISLLGVAAVLVASVAASASTVVTYQTSLGSPSGIPNGNVFNGVSNGGSAATVQAAIAGAVAGTLPSRTTYTREEATLWGDGGAYGGQLYMLSVVDGIAPGALLKVHKTMEYQYNSGAYIPGVQGDETWYPFGEFTYYYPMETYTQATGTQGNTYLTQYSEAGGTYTFVTGFAIADDLSTGMPGGGGGAGVYPSAWSDPNYSCLTGARQQLEVSIITDWDALTGETVSSRGYRYGTGYAAASSTVVDLGAYENVSMVVPEPTTLVIWSVLGLAGAGFGFWRKRK